MTATVRGGQAAPVTEAEVVVIGGGIVGVASAYYLAQRGIRVLLVEKGSIAGEASGRNGGHLSPTIDGPWAPLWGYWYQQSPFKKEEPPKDAWIRKVWDLWDKSRGEVVDHCPLGGERPRIADGRQILLGSTSATSQQQDRQQ